MSMSALLVLGASLLLSADGGSSKDDKTPERKPNPWAPSLPLLSEEEEKQLDEIIDRFILFDIGKLTGDEGKKAKEEFDKLGPDATLALLRGLNRAAKIESSCPALVIAKKLNRILGATEDKDLLDFAKDNIGAGVKQTRHAGMLSDLKLACTVRKSALVKAGVPNPPPFGSTPTNTQSKMTVAELVSTATTAKTAQAKLAVAEIVSRNSDDVLNVLASIATTVSDAEVKQTTRDALDKTLARLRQDAVIEKMKDKQAELRAAAARVAGSKGYRNGTELIDLLEDDTPDVREAAHQALVRLAGGKTDFGPELKSDSATRSEVIKKWRRWWAEQKN